MTAASASGAGWTAEARDGVRVFYRMLGRESNAPFPLKTRSVLLIEGEERTRTTGMATSGFTEYPFCKGRVSYAFSENFMYFPRIVSGMPIDSAKVNTGDVLVPQVFAPDGCVWGQRGTEFCQTFTASGRELVSMTLLVPSPLGDFRAGLVDGGPGGRPIGSSRPFRAGSLRWGWARWRPGEAPLEPGRTYGIRIWREDGEPWVPYLHATGDVYPGGRAYRDGVPQPETDLATWIVEEPPELSRGILSGADDAERVYSATGFDFVPRTPNVRLFSVYASPVDERCRTGVLTVWSTGDPPRVLARRRWCNSCAPPDGAYDLQFLFGARELEVTPGETYRAELRFLPFREGTSPDGEGERIPKDLQVRMYGEPEPGGLPAIGNLATAFSLEGDMRLSWRTNFDCPVTVTMERLGPHEETVHEVPAGTTELFLPKLWRGHDYRFSLEARGPSGLRWRTPDYQLRIPHGPHGPGPAYRYPEHPEVFVRVAPPTSSSAPKREDVLRFRARVPLANFSFEDGLEGWSVLPPGPVSSDSEREGIAPQSGRRMAGWTHRAEGHRRDPLEETRLLQRVETVPGHRYLMAARLVTAVDGGESGNARIRLLADPGGGEEFSGENSSQWYATGGRWMRFEHTWTATAERSTVGFGFFRWRDVDRSSAYVDHVLVVDLGTAALLPVDAASLGGAIPRLVLASVHAETEDRVEAFASAPRGYVITGLGARAAGDNITTMRLRVAPLRANGTLGPPEEILAGWEPDAGLEASVDCEEGHVVTGFGARIAPEWDVKTLAVWARPLYPDGTLGDEVELRAGVEPDGGLEKRVRAGPGRVLVSAGLRCGSNDVTAIRADSASIERSATARAGE